MDHIRWQDPCVIVIHHEVTDPAGLLDSQCQSNVAPHSILPHLIQARGCWSSPSTQHGEESQALISLRQPNLISTTRILPEEDFYYCGRPESSSLLAVAGGLPVLSKEKNSSGKWVPARSADDVLCFLPVPCLSICPEDLSAQGLPDGGTRLALFHGCSTATPAMWSSYADSMLSSSHTI